ncbi:MAG: DUF72 domain-containing protein [Candidatus Zixiibacteriota bacterium]
MNIEEVRIGTSGYSYDDWLGNFYPQFCPRADYLRFYSSQFSTVEIDATFYRIPTEKTVTSWVKSTPDGFIFSAKFPKAVTHQGNETERLQAAAEFVKVMSLLGQKLGPLLLQFPHCFNPANLPFLERLLASLPTESQQFVVEVRNRAWVDVDRFISVLAKRDVALCLIDHPNMPKQETSTSDCVYIRLLGDSKSIESDFSYLRKDRREELLLWNSLISRFSSEGKKVFVYFNNHYSGHSPTTARICLDMLNGAV